MNNRAPAPEIATLVPWMLDRLLQGEFRLEVNENGEPESLVLAASGEATPASIRKCLNEAFRCYIYVQFLAALFLCRTEIVSAVEERLKSKGYEKELISIPRADFLQKILKLAREKKLLDDAGYQQAGDIRDLANDAIHKNIIPNDSKCEDVFLQTGGPLEHIYA